MTPRTAQMTVTSRGIRVGIASDTRQHIDISPDAGLIQRALLAKTRKLRGKDYWPGVALVLVAIVFGVMAFAGWLPGAGA